MMNNKWTQFVHVKLSFKLYILQKHYELFIHSFKRDSWEPFKKGRNTEIASLKIFYN